MYLEGLLEQNTIFIVLKLEVFYYSIVVQLWTFNDFLTI